MVKMNAFSNSEIVKLLKKVHAAYTVKDVDKFRIMAYERAAASVEHSSSEIKDIWDDGKLEEVPGIGKGIASHLDELFRTGIVKYYEKLFRSLPKAMFVFLDIPGIGPKTAYILAKELIINEEKGAIEKLQKAAEDGKISVLENFGEKSEQDILIGIKALQKGEMKTKRMLLPYADELSSEIIDFLKKCPEVEKAHPLGSLRRQAATIGDIDISVSTKYPVKVIDYFLKFSKIKNVLSKGEKALLRVILFSGQQIDLRFSLPNKYGSMLQYFTGSKQHNIILREFALKKGMSLSEYGIKKVQSSKFKVQSSKLKIFSSEENFYRELGLDWIPPEIREGSGEIEVALSHKLPRLVELRDIKGDLHLHSNFPLEPSHDLGSDDVSTMIEEGMSLKYEYLGFTEHNPSYSNHTPKQILEILKKKKEYIEKQYCSIKKSGNNRGNKLPISILNGLEVDIKSDGRLAIPEEATEFVDYIIASVHSSFNMSKEKMTKRIIKGLCFPKVKILGHPTGRLLEEREGYELDWDEVFNFCLKNSKILEISAWPNRLDLPDVLVKEAVNKGVKMVINSDSHAVDQMKYVRYGVSVARRGWAEKKDIINALSFKELKLILM